MYLTPDEFNAAAKRSGLTEQQACDLWANLSLTAKTAPAPRFDRLSEQSQRKLVT